MRVQGAKKVHYDSGPNMTPLVDVVMVILIFLMLAGHFGGEERYLVSNLPIKQTGVGPTLAKPFDDTTVDIRVDGGMNETNKNYWVAHFGNVTTSDPETLRQKLEEKRLQYNSSGTPDSKLQVIINPNRLVKWQSLVLVYQAALQAKYTKVAFSTAH